MRCRKKALPVFDSYLGRAILKWIGEKSVVDKVSSTTTEWTKRLEPERSVGQFCFNLLQYALSAVCVT
jgi:hypothetical protein